MDQRKSHWENIYTHKNPKEVSWTQDKPILSLSWIESLALPKDAPIIDIGAGESHLVDYLFALGYTDLSVLDISKAALQKSQARLGKNAANVKWIEADITTFQAERTYALWHDRAVFHFLTQKRDVVSYTRLVSTAVNQYLLMSTFSKEGPLKCSGLPIMQYDANGLTAIFSSDFKLLLQQKEAHNTPFDTTQAFIYAMFQKRES